MNIGLFLFGLFVTGIVGAACALILIGLRESHREIEERKEGKRPL